MGILPIRAKNKGGAVLLLGSPDPMCYSETLRVRAFMTCI